jgi:DNA helicase HerA-like ATPase
LKALLGYDASARKRGQESPVEYDTDRLANPHISITGMSGSGKSFTIKKIIDGMSETAKQKLRVHMFDVHGDMRMEGCSSVMF